MRSAIVVGNCTAAARSDSFSLTCAIFRIFLHVIEALQNEETKQFIYTKELFI